MRILFVEDHEVFARTAADELLGGHEVTFAPDLRRGAALLAAGPFDLLLLDHDLPDGTGVELVAPARRAGLEVIAASGLESNNAALLAAGASFACPKDQFGELPALLAWLAGGGVDLLTAALRGRAKIPMIQRLREITGVGLQDAVWIVEAAREGRPLGHLTRARARQLAAVRRFGGWWSSFFADALHADRPWLTLVRGREDADPAGLGVVYHWALEQPPPGADLWLRESSGVQTPAEREALRRRLETDAALASACPGSLSGPGVRFDALRAELRRLLADEPSCRQICVLRDEPHLLTCRFPLE